MRAEPRNSPNSQGWSKRRREPRLACLVSFLSHLPTHPPTYLPSTYLPHGFYGYSTVQYSSSSILTPPHFFLRKTRRKSELDMCSVEFLFFLSSWMGLVGDGSTLNEEEREGVIFQIAAVERSCLYIKLQTNPSRRKKERRKVLEQQYTYIHTHTHTHIYICRKKYLSVRKKKVIVYHKV